MGLAVSGAYFVGLLRRKENPAERALWTKLDLPELYEQRRRRRTLGMTIMALISVAFFLGANFINPQVRPRAALAFWLVLLILLVWLCGLALVDLADLRGYGYHNGAMFAAYAGGQAQAIALGGRYDGAGAIFGRARPATGFSLDLRRVANGLSEPEPRLGILAPYSTDASLRTRVQALRAAGERVVTELPGQAAHRTESGCDRVLVLEQGEWQIRPLA